MEENGRNRAFDGRGPRRPGGGREMYYDSIDAMAERYDRTPKEYAFCAENPEEHRIWRERAKQRLWEISGLVYCERTDSGARVVRSEEMEGYVREYWLMTTEPGIEMPFYLLRPRTPNGAAILSPHGHGGGKERLLSLESGTGDAAARPAPTFAEELAADGFLVVCPDERGSGERRERFEQGDEQQRANSHRELQQIAIGFGQSMIGLAVWDLMRLLDVVEAMPEVEKGRIGCVGFSGGGQQTLWLAALDERIAAAAIGGYFYGMRDSLVLLSNNCACNYVPFMWRTMDMGDLGAMIAPRPLWIENGREDHLNGHRGLENVYEQLEITRRAYALYHEEERLTHRAYPGGHAWYGRGIREFFREALL